MSYTTRAYKVFIATPGDVPKERNAIEAAILELNRDFSEDAVYIPVRYENIPPSAGVNPQHPIDAKLDACDVLIFLFWTKLGEGTKGEIERHTKKGKYAMGYLLDKAVPKGILDGDKLDDLRKLHDFVKEAQSSKSNIMGLYRTVKSAKDLERTIQNDLRAIRPILAEKDKEHLDEESLTADWLSNVDDDNVIVEAIPKYKAAVSRRLALKLVEKDLVNNRSKTVWDAILLKFEGKDGTTNLMRTLFGLFNRQRLDHPLFEQGTKQLYINQKWAFFQLMKRIHETDINSFSKILAHADWISEEDRNRLPIMNCTE